MFKPLIWLFVGSLAAYGLTLLIAPHAALVAGYALGITLPPALVSAALLIRISEQWPLASPAAMIGGTGLRMCWALALVSVLGRLVEKVGIPRQSLAEWTCGFYLVTLALETAVLWGRLAHADRPRTGGRHE